MHLLRLSFNQSHSIQPYTLSLHDALPISRLEITIGLHHPLQQSRIVIAYFAHEIIEIGIANAAGGIGYADFDNLVRKVSNNDPALLKRVMEPDGYFQTRDRKSVV